MGNIASSSAACHDKPARYFSGVNEDIVELVADGAYGCVLDLGCGDGELGRVLKERGCAETVVGVEKSEAAARARLHLDAVHQVDIETWPLPEEYRGHFDCVVFGDVLEHLTDPWGTLARIGVVLRGGGVVVASIPNVRYIGVVAPLFLCGRWTYKSGGVLDIAHVRFFTKKSMVSLFEQAGYSVEVIRPRHHLSRAARVLARIVRGLGPLEEFVTRQYVIRGRLREEPGECVP